MPLPNNSRNLSQSNIKRIRRFRKEMSISERALWAQLRYRRQGFLFRRQYPIGPYALDFYCPEAMLCVEVDGEQHLGRPDKDEIRDQYLREKGIETIRIPSLDLFEPTGVKFARWELLIRETCERRAGRKAEDGGRKGKGSSE